MRSQKIPMSWDEFHRMPRRLGWKHEYWDGHARLSPGHQIVTVRLEVAPRSIPSTACLLRPAASAGEAGLVLAYTAAFRDSVEYCDWKKSQIEAAARENLQGFFAGNRGVPLPASRVAVKPGRGAGKEQIAGAALIVEPREGEPMLDLLFVVPALSRQCIATALVSAVLDELHRAGKKTLHSRYRLANEASRAWHQKFGFAEVPGDLCPATPLAHRADACND